MTKKQELTQQELERKMMQELYKELKRDNIPSVDGEVYLSDGVVLTPSGDVIEFLKHWQAFLRPLFTVG